MHTESLHCISLSKQSKHIVWLACEGVHHCSDLHTWSAANAAWCFHLCKKKITPAGALQHETFQLKCNFHPHCWGMKPGKRQKMGYDRKDAAEGERNKRLKVKEGRYKSLILQKQNLNRGKKIYWLVKYDYANLTSDKWEKNKVEKKKTKEITSEFHVNPLHLFPSLFPLFKLQHLILYLTLLINWPPLWANP